MTTPPRIRVGFVKRAVGLHGEVQFESLSDSPDRFAGGRSVHAGGRMTEVESMRMTPGGPVLKLAGVDDRDAAEKLRHSYLEIEAAEAAPLPAGSYYQWQLVGLEVLRSSGEPLGRLVEVLEYPANDVYVVRGPGGEVLVPALASVVLAVDIAAGQMTVDLPGEEEVR